MNELKNVRAKTNSSSQALPALLSYPDEKLKNKRVVKLKTSPKNNIGQFQEEKVNSHLKLDD